MTQERVECVVIGAGVVGLAVARALAVAGREVVVLEANARIGEEASSRNNEVIHAGFLYPPDTLKARLCRKGAEMMYAYCAERGIAHRRCGKLVPAVAPDEIESLRQLERQAVASGVPNIRVLSGSEARALEPEIRCDAALYSPDTGIVDTHALMLEYQGDAERHGASVAFHSRAIGGSAESGRFTLDVVSGSDTTRLACDFLVNCAGLGAAGFALRLAGYPAARVPRVYFAKGCFYALRGKPPFSRVIAPLGGSLAGGGAFTLDLAGQGKFGPDVEWVGERDYSVPADRAPAFGRVIRRYYPAFDESRIHPSYAGIRVRVSGPGEPLGDWIVEGPAQHGIEGLAQMYAVESPGLTSSLALGEHACALLGTLKETIQ